MKHKLLGVLMLLCALFFISVTIGGIMKGLPNLTVANESTGHNIGYIIGLGAGFLMMGIAIYVFIRNGIRNLKK